MKRVVMCEGKRDVTFVERYYDTRPGETLVTTFIGETVKHSRLKNEESESIANFLERRNPYDVLAKSENGKQDLKMAFTKLVNHLVRQPIELCLLIDLDDRSYPQLIDDLDTRVRDNYDGRTLGVTHQERLDRTPELLVTSSRLEANEEPVGEFSILAFQSCLEDAAAIEDGDCRETESQKLDRLLADDRLTTLLAHAL